MTYNFIQEKPGWLRKKVSLNNKNINEVKDLLLDLNLHTVCQSAKCPNIFECFSKKTATFMLLGDRCTRNCAFCSVSPGKPQAPDKKEPFNIALAVKQLCLNYIVLTSVTRDDLKDGGASQFAEAVRQIKNLTPGALIECLTPDFGGNTKSLKILLNESLEVLNHNIETVKKNYKKIRANADYRRSLDFLRAAKSIKPAIITKSGFMLGLGEEKEEIIELLSDLKKSNCDIVTIGQYLSPGKDNFPVQKYYSPEEFMDIENIAYSFDFKFVASGVFVRSSYQAAIAFQSVTQG